MSTYLLAFVAGKLGYKEATTKGGVIVRAYATPDKIEKTTFALDVAVKTLDFFNEYFALDYPLAKCDLVGLPDFSSGAMENWGCITFRESCYLVDEHSAIAVKQYTALVVAHELAHQWFGNLVTMQWWDDLWLNESFATCIEYLAINNQFPDWQLWTQFYDSETVHALDRDSLATVQRVRQPVSDPEEIRTLFDGAIVYAKGASLLRMLHEYIGAQNFRDGLRVYLDRHQYDNAQAADLWQALGEVSGKDIGQFMQPWISQAGHPVVKVEQQDNTVHLTQERFFSNPKEKTDTTTLWPIPLLSSGQLNTEVLEDRQTDLQATATNLPFFLNQGHTGFYLTQYSHEQLQTLATAIQDGKLGVIDRLGLLSEAYDLAKAGRQSTASMLTLLAAYKQESVEPVWGAISSAVGALKLLINEDPAYKPLLQRFVVNLSQLQFQRLGWEAIQDEPYFDALLRPAIIGLMSYSEEPQIIEHALALSREAKQPEDIWGNIRGTIMVVAARNGTQADFNRVKEWYHTQTSAELRIQLAAGLSATRNTQNIQELLETLTTKAIKLQDLFYWFVYLIRNPTGRQLTWDWMVQNWTWIEEKFKSDMHYDSFSTYAAGAFSTIEELAQYKTFFEPKLDNPALKRSILQGIESIESRLLWRERDLLSVQTFLTDQVAKQ
jgi:aminopeptidase N